MTAYAGTIAVADLERDPYPVYARLRRAIALRVLCEAMPDLALDDGYDVTFWGWEFRAPTAVHVRW